MSGSHVTLIDADIHRTEGGLTALAGPVAVGLTESLLDPTGATRVRRCAVRRRHHAGAGAFRHRCPRLRGLSRCTGAARGSSRLGGQKAT